MFRGDVVAFKPEAIPVAPVSPKETLHRFLQLLLQLPCGSVLQKCAHKVLISNVFSIFLAPNDQSGSVLI